MKKRVLLLTGSPGVGKTTVLIKTVNMLKERGVSVGGMISREVRENGFRVGFEILDFVGGRHGWLSHISQENGPRIGKYRVNIFDLDNVGVAAIYEAIETCDVVAIDEIGPMELFSKPFKNAVEKALLSTKPVLAVVHARAKDPLIARAKQIAEREIYAVSLANRNQLPQELVMKILE